MTYHILSYRLRFLSLSLVISMLSIQCDCGLSKEGSQTTPKTPEINHPETDHPEIDRLIKLVRDKTTQDPKLYSLLAVLEKIKKGENLGTTTENIQNWAGHETPLYDAVTFFDEPALIAQLTKNGLNITIEELLAIGDNRPPLLHRAIEVGHIQVAKFLIQHGSNINEQDKQKRTPLDIAIVNRRTEALKWLIEQDAKLNSPSNHPYLILATQNNYLEGVNLLLESPQIDINAQDSAGFTALHRAAYTGKTEIVKALLGTKKVDLYITTTGFKDTALIEAAEFGFLEIVSSLINYDSTPAHLNATDKLGYTAIVRATVNNRPTIVQILLDKGADPDILGSDGETALQIAKRKKYQEIEKILSARPK